MGWNGNGNWANVIHNNVAGGIYEPPPTISLYYVFRELQQKVYLLDSKPKWWVISWRTKAVKHNIVIGGDPEPSPPILEFYKVLEVSYEKLYPILCDAITPQQLNRLKNFFQLCFKLCKWGKFILFVAYLRFSCIWVISRKYVHAISRVPSMH